MEELQRIKLTEGIQRELDTIDSSIQEHIAQFVKNIQDQRTQAVATLLRGYLADKEHPKDADIKIEDGELIFFSKGEVKPN